VRLNPNLPSKLEETITKALEKDRNLRYQHASEIRTDLQRLKRDTDSGRSAATIGDELQAPRKYHRVGWAMATGASMILVIGLVVGSWLFQTRKVHALKATDTVVLADFTNKTGDAVFDDTLKQALSVSLAQSPFLNILSEEKMRSTLKLMGRSADEPLPPGAARDLCQRTGSAAVFAARSPLWAASTCWV
jgi:hypothetical protein